MARKAVDVVLLPSEQMMYRAIEVNAELVGKFGEKIVLNKENCLPHISLAMGCIDEKDIADIERILQSIAGQRPLVDLTVSGIKATRSGGEKVSVFEIEKTKELQLLHKKVMEELALYFTHKATADTVISAPEVVDSTLLWINNYREKSSFANFSPHITVGFGETENQSFPIKFTASKLALCHLGNHCTCREILVSIELEG